MVAAVRRGAPGSAEPRAPHMAAVAQHRYGGPEVLALEEVLAPAAGAGEVLIRVAAAAVSAGDVLVMRGEPRLVRLAFGVRRPKRPTIGRDVSGEVVAVGDGVTRFRVGEAVFAESDQGGWAELVAVPERFVAHRPGSVDAAHAAAVPVSGTTALQGLRLAGVRAGSRVLVNGASGGVGGFAVQLAVALGAHVTGVSRGAKAAHVHALGADRVIDYRTTDFTRQTAAYDVVFDLVGDRPLGAVRRTLAPGGTLLLASGRGGRVLGPMRRILAAGLISPFVPQRLRILTARRNGDDLAELARRIDSGEIRPVVDEVVPLERVADAVRRLEAGDVRGKLVLAIGRPASPRSAARSADGGTRP
ncbi:NAD(P)-dependent alcohol dehydrogenase [Agromyces sp. G08B096]|uniref:NAD(P)-dependent alcohol dehydrogenase n=1 Tax=Agromyces sp. G08B096 TaxID=3156399 RepID=A0AAU7WCE4_9MICO